MHIPKFRKKAQGLNENFMTLILVIVVALLAGWLVMGIYHYMTNKGDVEGCKLSVLVASQWNDATLGTVPFSPPELECPRKSIVFYPEYYTVDGDEKKYSKEEYADSVKEVLAKEMVECWDKMGAGQLNPITPEWVTTDITGKKMCVVCSMFSFDKPHVDDVGDITEYLEETTMPLSSQNQEKQTYYAYLYQKLKYTVYDVSETGYLSPAQVFGFSPETEVTTNLWIYVDTKLNDEPIMTDRSYALFYVDFVPWATGNIVLDPIQALALYSTDNFKMTEYTCDMVYS